MTEYAEDFKYGCVFCLTGQEDSVVESLEAQNPGLDATSVYQVKPKSEQGVIRKVTQRILPGYVYFRTKSDDPPDMRYIQDSIRLLEMTKGYWALSGMDEWFAKWVFVHHGVIGYSLADIVENRVRMLSGPLKELERYIVRVDKRARGGQVALPFHEREVRMWLKYDLV